MYLVDDRLLGTNSILVFTWQDPRKDGYQGTVIENVALDYDQSVHDWPDGADRPEPCVGRARRDPRSYKVFRSTNDLPRADYEPVPGAFAVFQSWHDYLRLRLTPPDPQQTSEQDWFDYLDRIDEGARLRRLRPDELGQPESTDREAVAAWVAKRHFNADSGLREVWYLPEGAPPEEIRLLELSDRLPGNELAVEPIDFGLDVEGVPFRLVVADVTTDQLEKVKQDPSRLPTGWSLDGNRIWRRRGA